MEELKTTPVVEQMNTEAVDEVVMVKSEVVLTKKPLYDFVKRLADILISAVILTCGLPIFVLIAILIMIDDFGNPFFMQERIGKDGKAFNMFKFRTMFVNADEMKVDLMAENEYDSVHFKMSNDPRITRVGKFLRKTSIDELPQILNVFLGHMTIIGPRPFVRSEQEQLPSDRLLVKPGLSCYWQITDTVKMSNEDQLELDYKYIRNRSIWTDIMIVFSTIKMILGAKND